jgi:uncharacterized membrane protein YbhN (UPF0104 family)
LNRNTLMHAAGSLLAIIALVYFAHTMLIYWVQASSLLLQAKVPLSAMTALTALIIGYLLSALAWRQICVSLGARLSVSATLRIYFVSQFGKYLPGNIAQHAGRLALSVREGLAAPTVILSQFVEIGLVMGLVAVVAATTGLSDLREAMPGTEMFTSTRLVIVASLALLLVLLGIWLLYRRGQLSQLLRSLRDLMLSRHGLTHFAAATALALANTAIATTALYVIAATIAGADMPSPWVVACAYTVSWLVGFVTPGAPAGIGVREAIMLGVLSTTMTPAQGAAIVVVFRIVTTLTDLLVFIAGLCLTRWRRAVTAA